MTELLEGNWAVGFGGLSLEVLDISKVTINQDINNLQRASEDPGSSVSS